MLVRELPYTGGKSAAESEGATRTLIVSFSSARRRRVGCDRCGDRLLRNGARLRQIASTIWPPDCRLSTRAGKTRLDGARDYEGAIARVASHAPDGGGHGTPCADLAGEAQQRVDGARMRTQGARHPGRRGHHRSLFRDTAPHEP